MLEQQSTFLLTNPFVSKAQFVLEIHLVVLLKPVPVLQSDSFGLILQPLLQTKQVSAMLQEFTTQTFPVGQEYTSQTIDQSLTKLNHVTLDGAYGIPVDIDGQGTIKYGSLVFDGASLSVTNPTFKDINTTNVLATNGASPTLDGGTFVVGVDEQGYQGAAIQAYGAGAGLVVMQVLNSAFTGEETDCGAQGGGRSAIYLENSFVRMDTLTVSENSYGAFLRSSSGYLTNSTITTKW